MKRAILIDGDDTLWSTMPLYSRVKHLFAQRTAALLPLADEAIAYLDEIDQSNIVEMGFSRQRFPRSLVEAYSRLCADRGISPDPCVTQELRRNAEAIFSTAAVNMPDATSALGRLAEMHELILVTKGDHEVQSTRIQQSRLQPFFTHVRILPDKTAESLQLVITELRVDAARAWSIGNSIRSDINPALSLGMSAVWIPCDTWRHEQGVLLESLRLFKCQSLTEAADVILNHH